MKLKMYSDYKATNQCRLSIAKEPLFPDQIAFAMPKMSPLTEIFNHEYEIYDANVLCVFVMQIFFPRLVWLRQMGLLNHWTNSFLPRPYRCLAPTASLRPTPNQKLTVNYLLSAFLLYGVGVLISIFIFAIEMIAAQWIRIGNVSASIDHRSIHK